jgi:hypothetical protein
VRRPRGRRDRGRRAWASDTIESFDAAEIERRIGGFTVDDFVLIVTRDHAIDQRLLEQLIVRDDIGYLGMIGSRGKVGRFRKRLEVRGLLDGELGAARWARLRAPIGLNLGAETPEKIAVAIVAQLVAFRRRGVAAAAAWTPVRADAGARRRRNAMTATGAAAEVGTDAIGLACRDRRRRRGESARRCRQGAVALPRQDLPRDHRENRARGRPG